MIQSLELILDEDADAAIRAEWEALAAAGLPSQALHRGVSNRPHVTLLVRAALPLPGSVEGIPLPLVLGSPIVLGVGERRTIARLVVPSRELLELHRELHDAVGPGDDAPHSTPGELTPHVTLARRVPLADVGRAVALVGAELRATAVGLRHWNADTRVVTTVAAGDK
ncbi:2'-5' RNA ligase family protein [Pseudolysinimonas sp.]|uniref:2'-5' RNA ligase family protein n=1 Tax=Pseudolysinimonas sp. TaxID=2680009 RepID=UPI003F80B554